MFCLFIFKVVLWFQKKKMFFFFKINVVVFLKKHDPFILALCPCLKFQPIFLSFFFLKTEQCKQ